MKASGVQVACVEVVQGNETGRYAEALRLQCLHTDRARDATPVPGTEIWRTVVEAKGLSGGLTQLQIPTVR